MDLTIDILTRRQTRFVLWSPREQSQNPRLVLGKFKARNPPSVDILKQVRIPRESCHRFQVNPATDSTPKLPPVPHESCH